MVRRIELSLPGSTVVTRPQRSQARYSWSPWLTSPHDQALELKPPAGGRVADQPAVGLQARRDLGHAGQREPNLSGAHAGSAHHLPQSRLVLVDIPAGPRN